MSDPELVHAILSNILTAMSRIERRFEGITMMLIAIGEQLKRLDTVSGIDLDDQYPQVDWKGAKGIRDFLSHHLATYHFQK